MNYSDLTQDEKVEVFRSNLDSLINSCGLSVSEVFFIFKSYFVDLNESYIQYRKQILASLNDKIKNANDSEEDKVQQNNN